MAQDFAKQRSTQRQQARQNSKSASNNSGNKISSHWSWFFSGLISGILVTFISYLGIVKSVSTETQFTNAANAENTPDIINIENVEDESDFDFYEYLPNAEVLVDVVPVAVVPDEVVNDTVNYLLQAGSFQNRDDAENRRAKIILLNMEANVVPGVVSGRTWHRVQVGPFVGRSTTEVARDNLSSNNIDAIILRMR